MDQGALMVLMVLLVNVNQDGPVFIVTSILMTVLKINVKTENASTVSNLMNVNATRVGLVSIVPKIFDAILTLVNIKVHANQRLTDLILLAIVWAIGLDLCVQLVIELNKSKYKNSFLYSNYMYF